MSLASWPLRAEPHRIDMGAGEGEVAKTNTGPFTMAAVQGHVQTALDHVAGIERDFRQADGVMEELHEAVVISIGADEAEESSSESESSE